MEVANRFDRTAYVRSVPATRKDADHAAGDAGQASLPAEPLKKGERVITAGRWNSSLALENKQSENVKPAEPKTKTP